MASSTTFGLEVVEVVLTAAGLVYDKDLSLRVEPSCFYSSLLGIDWYLIVEVWLIWDGARGTCYLIVVDW